MHIFIDESGTFSPVAPGAHSVSVVGALIIPDQKLGLLFERYKRLRLGLRKSASGEVKGKLLYEAQVARVSELLLKNNCLFEAVAMDMGLETAEGMEASRARQAAGLTKTLTDEHEPEVIEKAWQWRRILEKMPLPLYAQSMVTFELLAMVLYHAPFYYSQRAPRELEYFHWTIDGKEVGKVTRAEDWWSNIMLPLLEVRSLGRPMDIFDGGDYSFFEARFFRDTPERLKPYSDPQGGMINLRKLMKESFRFSSDPEPGLELVDVVTNATRRALHGNLAYSGWRHIPRLMIHRRKQYLTILNLTRRDGLLPRPPYAETVVHRFARGGRPMHPPGMSAT